MTKPKVINLNKWTRVPTEQDMENYTGMIIIPNRLEDNTQPPPIFFRQGEPKEPFINNPEGQTWFKEARIDNRGQQKDYNALVDWWFDGALADEEYKTILNDTYNCNGYNLKIAWDKAKAWLKGCPPDARKTYIHKFIWNWLSKGMQWRLSKIEKEQK